MSKKSENTLHMRNSTTGYDEITSKVTKLIIDILSWPLTYTTNVSFIEGVFRYEIKIA